jgi:hypothetical protein
MQSLRNLVFAPDDFGLICYGKLMRYFYEVCHHFELPCKLINFGDYCQQRNPNDIFVMSYCCLQRINSLPTDQPFMFVVAEPYVNIEKDMINNGDIKTKIISQCVMMVTLMKPQIDWLHTYFGMPCYSFYVGYIEHEDINVDDFAAQPKHYDIVMPGCGGTPDRCRVIHEIRSYDPTEGKVLDTRKLSVEDRSGFHQELDALIKHGKVYVYTPASVHHHTFPGQRILWAINKRIGVVSVLSSDTDAEEFYKGLYIACPASDVPRHCYDLCIKGTGDKWKQFARESYERYKRKFHAFDIFPPVLLIALQNLCNQV